MKKILGVITKIVIILGAIFISVRIVGELYDNKNREMILNEKNNRNY